MITRSQAEALLTLAEALEACGNQGMLLRVPGRCNVELHGMAMVSECLNLNYDTCALSPVELRLLVSELAPKSIGS